MISPPPPESWRDNVRWRTRRFDVKPGGRFVVMRVDHVPTGLFAAGDPVSASPETWAAERERLRAELQAKVTLMWVTDPAVHFDDYELAYLAERQTDLGYEDVKRLFVNLLLKIKETDDLAEKNRELQRRLDDLPKQEAA